MRAARCSALTKPTSSPTDGEGRFKYKRCCREEIPAGARKIVEALIHKDRHFLHKERQMRTYSSTIDRSSVKKIGFIIIFKQ
jgi:hypothetical protein